MPISESNIADLVSNLPARIKRTEEIAASFNPELPKADKARILAELQKGESCIPSLALEAAYNFNEADLSNDYLWLNSFQIPLPTILLFQDLLEKGMLKEATSLERILEKKKESNATILYLFGLLFELRIKAGNILLNRYPEVISEYYYKAAKLGSADAFFRMAQLYQTGKVDISDTTLILQLFQAALDLGKKEACYEIAQIYESNSDYKKAIEYHKMGKENGLARSAGALSMYYLDGEFVRTNRELGDELWELADQLIRSEDRYKEALALETGSNKTAIDKIKAIALYEQSSKFKHAPSMVRLAMLLEESGENSNIKRAIELYLFAITDAKDPIAAYRLMNLSRSHPALFKDIPMPESISYLAHYAKFRESAQRYSLRIHSMQEGKRYTTVQDFCPEVYFQYLQFSVSMGNPEALFQLGNHYYIGHRVSRNIEVAFQYYKNAAELGHQLSRIRLAQIKLLSPSFKQRQVKDIFELVKPMIMDKAALEKQCDQLGFDQPGSYENQDRTLIQILYILKVLKANNLPIEIPEVLKSLNKYNAEDISTWYKEEKEAYDEEKKKAGIEGGINYYATLRSFEWLAELGITQYIIEFGEFIHNQLQNKGSIAINSIANAMFLLEFASRGKKIGAATTLGQLYEHLGNYEEAVTYYKVGAERGEYKACYNLVHCYYDGKGCERNLKLAYKMLLSSYKYGNKEFKYYLGLALDNLEQADAQELIGYYEAAARNKNGFAAYELARLYEKGRGVIDQDKKKARIFSIRAYKRGYKPTECLLIGAIIGAKETPRCLKEILATDITKKNLLPFNYLYDNIKNVGVEFAIAYLEKANEAGYTDANLYLGHIYFYGEHREPSYDKALDYYRKAIVFGGKLVAITELEKLVAMDHVETIVFLANIYEKGEIVDRDADKAKELYAKASALDLQKAKDRLYDASDRDRKRQAPSEDTDDEIASRLDEVSMFEGGEGKRKLSDTDEHTDREEGAKKPRENPGLPG